MPEIRPFPETTLNQLAIDLKVPRDAKAAGQNPHVDLLQEYLTDIGVKVVVIEDKYVDADYLSDYTLFYATCFNPPPTHCKRLHFFAKAVTQADLKRASTSATEQARRDAVAALQESYRGFIVLKPLRDSFIGRTCLATYDHHGEYERLFPATRDYFVHLAGIKLKIKSMAFQEQDVAVAACATTAIWSALQVAGHTYRRGTPTPAEITTMAVDHRFSAVRPTPSIGLQDYDIAFAIKKARLDPISARTPYLKTPLLLAMIRAYSEAKVPPILGLTTWIKNGSNWEKDQGHAVTVSGYAWNEKGGPADPELVEFGGIRLHSGRIAKFYVHDDGTVPFASTTLERAPKKVTKKMEGDGWWLKIASADYRAEVDTVILPAYHKMRVPIEDVCSNHLLVFEDLLESAVPGLKQRAAWDIRLLETPDLQAHFATAAGVPEDLRYDLACRSWPHYCWLAILLLDGTPSMTVVLDATGATTAFCCERIVIPPGASADFVRDELLNRIEELSLADNWQEHEWADKLREAVGAPPKIS